MQLRVPSARSPVRESILAEARSRRRGVPPVAERAETLGDRAADVDHRLRAGDSLMAANEIARLLGGDPATSEEWVRRNLPNRVALGRKKIRFWRSDVVRYLAEASE